MEVYFGDRNILSRLIGPGIEVEINYNTLRKGFLFVVVGDNSRTFTLFFIRNMKSEIIGTDLLILQGEHILTLQQSNTLFSYSDIGKFITIFQSEKMYLSLLNTVGKTNFFSCLKKLREYNYLNRMNPEKSLLKGFEKNSLFKKTLNNKETKYLSERGLDRFFLNVIEKKKTNDISSLKVDVPLKGNGKLHLDFNFEAKGLVRSDLFALIGKNGVGKSQSLKAIKSLSIKSNLFKKTIDINLYSSINRAASPDYVSLKNDSSSKINLVLSVRNLIQKRERYNYFDAISIIKDFCMNDLNCSKVLITLSDGRKENLWSRDIDYNFIDTEKKIEFFKNNREFTLSSGQNYLLSLVLILLLHIESHSIVLIDEPEVYLHPNLIKKSHSIIQKVLEATYSKAIISTHSIFLIREMPKEYVKILASSNGTSFSRSPTKETFGASLDRLADEIFYDDEYETSFDQFAKDFKQNHQNIKMVDVKHLPTSLAARILADD